MVAPWTPHGNWGLIVGLPNEKVQGSGKIEKDPRRRGPWSPFSRPHPLVRGVPRAVNQWNPFQYSPTAVVVGRVWMDAVNSWTSLDGCSSFFRASTWMLFLRVSSLTLLISS